MRLNVAKRLFDAFHSISSMQLFSAWMRGHHAGGGKDQRARGRKELHWKTQRADCVVASNYFVARSNEERLGPEEKAVFVYA
jgi:hypothetical protein